MTLAELCVKRGVFAVMLITFLVVLGIFSFRELGVDLFPRADPATVNISVRLPGATPEEVTTQVVLPLEEALSTISGLDEMTSMASEGSARLRCQFVLEREIESAAQDVREKVAGALRSLPPTILPPIIQKADPDADPVLTLVVAGDKSLRETTEIADKKIKRVLETVDGVGEVSLTGARLRQIRVFADADKLAAYGLTIIDVENAIESENVEIPGGTIVRGDSELGIRTLGRLDAVGQFGDIIVKNVGGSPVRVSDLGRVEDSFAEPRSWNMLEGKQAVSLEVRRQSGTNTVKIIDTIKREIARIEKTLPPGLTLRIIRDQSVFINASIASLEEHLLFGGLLASLVVFLFIRSLRSVVIASLAIPTSIVATFTILKAMDFTLNNMTLLALTLAVGIVIDDAIVVLENIVRYIEEKHYEPRRAAIEATKEITLAVMATTLSLVIIFLPIAFMSGYARRYVNQFGWTMAFAIMVSMLVSFTLTPMLSSRLLRAAPAGGSHHATKDWPFFAWIDHKYGSVLGWALGHRRAVMAAALGVFLLAFPLNALVGRDWIPPDDQGELTALLNLPEGTSLDATSRVVTDIAAKVAGMKGIEFVNPYVHEGLMSHAHIYVKLAEERSFSNQDAAAAIRRICAGYPNLRSRVVIPSALGGGETFFPIRALLLGPDFETVVGISKDAAARIRTVPGLLDVDTSVSLNRPEMEVSIDRQRASDLGVRAADVGNAVRLMIAGEDQISTYKEGDEQYDVTLQLLPEQQKDPEVLSRLMIPSAKVGEVRLDNVAAISRGLGPTRIERYNRQFQVGVFGNNAPDFPLDAAARAVGEEVRKTGLPEGYSFRFTGAVKILDETTRNLIIAFLLASIFMYMVLAAQFDSFLHPFTIMLSLPLSIPFALFSLWITGRTLNLWSALGVLLLLGIVKKNGILQVDYTNKLRAQGVPLREAIVQANHVRLRPILMTTLSIVAGLIPTALGMGAGAAQRSAVAVTIIGGQMLCLLPTLLVTPVAYSLFAEAEERGFKNALAPFFTRAWAGVRAVSARLHTLLIVVAALASLMGPSAWAEAQPPKSRLILLGTGGGPRPRAQSAAASQVIVVNGSLYVVDCGDGVARQLTLAGLSLDRLRHVYVTHQHSDHNADYGNLIWLSWASGLRTRVDAWGPPPLEKMTRLFFEMNAYDIDTRIANEKRVPLAPLVQVHELSRAGPVMQDEYVTVTAALVDHPPVVPAFAYRFDAADRSIVISGDTAPTEALVSLARGADVLVHSALYPPAIDRMVARVLNAAALKQSILAHQTSAEDAGRAAQAAGVKTLVLSHLVPPDDPQVTEAMWLQAARSRFRGRVIVGRDLLEID